MRPVGSGRQLERRRQRLSPAFPSLARFELAVASCRCSSDCSGLRPAMMARRSHSSSAFAGPGFFNLPRRRCSAPSALLNPQIQGFREGHPAQNQQYDDDDLDSSHGRSIIG